MSAKHWLLGCSDRYELFDRLAAENRDIMAAEIGVAEGRNAADMLRRVPRMTLHMIDPWEHQPKKQWNDGGNRPQPEMDDWYRQALERTDEFADRRRVHRAYSPAVAAEFANDYFDFVFLDGNHSYDAVVADIAAWWPKVKAGGILAGHDYVRNPDKNVVGVIPAVREFMAREKLQMQHLTGCNDCSWAIRKPL